jgi:hypothetical protein
MMKSRRSPHTWHLKVFAPRAANPSFYSAGARIRAVRASGMAEMAEDPRRSAERRRALELLAASPDGCTAAILLAHGSNCANEVG